MGHRRMWLALTSPLLSLAPLVALVLLRALPISSLYGTTYTVLTVTLYAGALIGSVGAVVTGVWAERGNQQQPPLPPALSFAAGAGVVIGIAGIVLLVCAGVTFALWAQGCSINPAACG